MNILLSQGHATQSAVVRPPRTSKASDASDSNGDKSLFDSVTTGMADALSPQVKPMMAMHGAIAGVRAGIGLAGLASKYLPSEAALPGMVLIGAVSLSAAIVGAKVAWELSPSLASAAISQSESAAAKLHLPKGTGKLIASAAWLGSLSCGIAAGGISGQMTTATVAITALAMGLGGVTGAMNHARRQSSP